jgi:ABC-type transport system involved in multi-copper enzyme maturation permease subunit
MDQLTFEWRRARSIRTTWITSLFVVLSTMGFAYLGTLVTAEDEAGAVSVTPPTDLLSGSFIGNPIAIVLLASLGAMAFGHEYRYGTIRLTLTAFPRRTGVFFAKLSITTVIALVVAAVSIAAAYGVLLITGDTSGDLDWAGLAWQVAVFAVTYALLAFSITVLTRSHPLGIVGPLLLSILETVLIGLLGARFGWLADVLPLTAMGSWLSGEDVAASAGVWAAWMLGLLLVGFILLRRRDA